jgi:hypothetical protein
MEKARNLFTNYIKNKIISAVRDNTNNRAITCINSYRTFAYNLPFFLFFFVCFFFVCFFLFVFFCRTNCRIKHVPTEQRRGDGRVERKDRRWTPHGQFVVLRWARDLFKL